MADITPQTTTTSGTSTETRSLVGHEDLLLYYSLLKPYKKFVLSTPHTFEHYLFPLPYPSIYSLANDSTLSHSNAPSTLLSNYQFAHVPPPLQTHSCNPQLVDRIMHFGPHASGDMGLVDRDLKNKGLRRQMIEKERRELKAVKKEMKKEKRRLEKKRRASKDLDQEDVMEMSVMNATPFASGSAAPKKRHTKRIQSDVLK
jgi:hypothetical protein